MRETVWRRKVVRPILEFLRQGLTPEKLSFTIALGITLGVTPVLGSTVLLCTLAAIAFRLNLAAIQLVNWLVYPFQLALLIPFYRIGGWMFRTPPSELSVVHILALIRTNLFHAVATLWTVTIACPCGVAPAREHRHRAALPAAGPRALRHAQPDCVPRQERNHADLDPDRRDRRLRSDARCCG